MPTTHHHSDCGCSDPEPRQLWSVWDDGLRQYVTVAASGRPNHDGAPGQREPSECPADWRNAALHTAQCLRGCPRVELHWDATEDADALQWALGSLDDVSHYWRLPTSTTVRATGRELEAALDRLAQLGLHPWGRRLPDPVDCCF